MYFNVNFNVFFKLIKVHLLVSELYIHQNARCNDQNRLRVFKNRVLREILGHKLEVAGVVCMVGARRCALLTNNYEANQMR